MKTLIIYSSQTGFTERYASWLKETLDAECISIKNAKSVDLSSYDKIVYGGWCCAGSINGLNSFIGKLAKAKDDIVANNKKVAIFAVGSSPIENPDVSKALDKINSDVEKKLGSKIETMKTFYCPGGLNYEKMNTPSKLAMKMFVSILKSNKNKTEKDEIQIKMISSSFDIADKRHIEPILEFVK